MIRALESQDTPLLQLTHCTKFNDLEQSHLTPVSPMNCQWLQSVTWENPDEVMRSLAWTRKRLTLKILLTNKMAKTLSSWSSELLSVWLQVHNKIISCNFPFIFCAAILKHPNTETLNTVLRTYEIKVDKIKGQSV